MDILQQHIQALVFCAEAPVSIEEMQRCLSEVLEQEISVSDVLESIEAINQRLAEEAFAFQIYAIGGGYQFLTKPDYQDSVGLLLKYKSKKRLSVSAMETLAIIAYKQPVTKTMVEQIRGVGCDYAIQRLLEKELIEIKGKAETIGRPVLYGTSQKFMEYFGINHIKDLPQLKDFAAEENMIGEISEN
ncbi:MAG: SMC-Scp complex subunit ScpB [Hymenobacteraceae bacterium]|nr:SMC-Scp complex subunit ScpB [Hymenobacteraceae bacterium]MDX5398050.1 SMC-Scp complex subunit ScpB [Hymenobacteraceae bacterium]MDX5442268.1 SMC-Scp complex subunit ScpB [Hymenobacteraceae bacterium]MDX5514121.1 SMC-Scp complex subunit ScpB [Hymenobacteraceae bacterium]